MNQMDKASLVRKLLKPKQQWRKDSEATHCFACQKQFLPIVRWRHHCRFCGNIFCSKCSENIINGEDIDYKEEKRLRHCENCRQRIKKAILEVEEEGLERKSAKFDITDHQIKLELDQTTESSFMNFEDEKSGFRLKEQLEKVSRDIEEEVGKMAFELCGKHLLDCGTWAKRMAELALKTISEVQVDSFVRPEPFSLIREIRVLTIATPRDCVTGACVRGLILERNIPSKTLSTHFKYPNILIFRPAIQAEGLTQKEGVTQKGEGRFVSMIKNQEAILKSYLQKIYKLKPNVIFVEEHVSKLAFEEFLQNEIMVISKVRREDLRIIERLAMIRKSIDHLQFIDKYRPADVIGVCERIYFKTVKQGEMLMFIEQDQAGIRSVLLGDYSEEINARLKVAFTQLMSMAWVLRKTREIILKDLKFMGEEKMVLVLGDEMDWDRYNTGRRSNALQIQGTKIVYKCQRSEELSKPYEAYCSRVGHPFFLQFCDFPKPFRTRFYEDNILLGTYLLKCLADSRRNCHRCSTTHVQRYYINNHYVTIRFETHKDRLTGKIMQKVEDSEDDEPLRNWYEFEEQAIYQSIVRYLQKSKEKMFFTLFFKCESCEYVVGESKARIGRDYLAIHFYHYLTELINSYQKARQSCPSYDYRKQNPCSHPLIARVIHCPRLLIKFYVSQSEIYHISPIDNKAMRKSMQTKDEKYLKEIYSHEINEKCLMMEQLERELHKMPFSLSTTFSFASISGLPFHEHPYYEYYLRVTQLLGKAEEKLSEIESIYLGYFTVPEHDWTITMRKFYKIEHVLKMLFDIVNYISSGLKKQKFQEAPEELLLTEFPIAKMRKDSVQTELAFTSPTRVGTKFSSTASMVSLLGGMRKQTGGTELQQMDDIFKKSRKYRFPLYQGRHLYFPIGNINDPVSLLACCLNSDDFSEQLKEQAYHDFITCRLTFNKYLQTEWGLNQESYRLYRDLLREDYPKNQTYEYSFSTYYHREFQELRMSERVDFPLYVRSLYGCQNWDSSGGKSNSTFSKSHNEVLVVKIINQKEFVEFQKFAPAYLKYMKDKRDNSGLSYLAKIYGIYEATIRSKIYKFVVMQNIFLGMSGPLKVYDLKGSEVNRLATPVGDQSFTGLDTNFTIDKDGRPYILDPQVYDATVRAFEGDAGFLRDQSVIDYSLLVIESQRTLRMGIIDFMRPYHFIQKIETIYKEIKSGKDPTVIPPLQYSERFISAMKKYFIKVNIE